MQKKIVSIFLGFSLVFLALQAYSQSGFIEESIWSNVNPQTGLEEDFVITKSGEKIFGKIISDYDQATYKTLIFESNGEKKNYTTLDLNAFGLENSRFFMTKRLPEIDEEVFVQILVSGPLQLNYYDQRYFLDNGEEISELKAFYTVGSIDGNKLKRYVKAYMSVLKLEMAGECGVLLNDMIETTKMDEQDFIRLFTAYNECQGGPNQVHVSKVKFMKVAPVLTAGVSMISLLDRSVERGQLNDFGNNLALRFLAGVRLKEFRKLPRISIDFGLGLEQFNSTFESDFESPGVVSINAVEEFKETSVFVPFSFNYSVFRKDNLDLYAGVMAAIWFRSLNIESTEIREEIFQSDRVNLYNTPILEGPKRLFVPGLKVGARIPAGKMTVFTELQGDLQLDYYTANILAKRSSFSRSALTFQIGLEF
ncbi:hypothetical protein ACFOSV_00435 [Algoriphagus namhaensis]|uniref:Outer membrane protein beta-barrel domain-containing protein n=1 Tax=Algoriphagus namhaensis TaxID=915353 RepID=A0ABV8AMP2_9BACT